MKKTNFDMNEELNQQNIITTNNNHKTVIFIDKSFLQQQHKIRMEQFKDKFSKLKKITKTSIMI